MSGKLVSPRGGATSRAATHLVDAILLWLGRLENRLFFLLLLLLLTFILNQGFKNISALQEKVAQVSGGLWLPLGSVLLF